MNTTRKITKDQPIRVLQVISQRSLSIEKSGFTDLLSNLDESTIQTTVLIFGVCHADNIPDAWRLDFHSIKRSILGSMEVVKRIKRLIEEKKIDIIHAYGTIAALLCTRATKQSETPLVYSVDSWSFNPLQSYIVSRINILRECHLCKRSSIVICTSHAIEQIGQEAFSMPSARVIHDGFNINTSEKTNKRKSTRGQLGIAQEDFVIGYFDKLEKSNDPIAFIESVRQANDQIGNIVGLITDSGKWEKKVLKYISNKNLERIIHVSKPTSQIPDLIQAIDILATTSLNRTPSWLIAQAMARKKAIVATPTESAMEVVIDNFNGKIAPFGDPKAIAQKYIEYYTEPDTIILHTQNAATLIASHFNCVTNAAKIVKIYQEIVFCGQEEREDSIKW